MLWSAIVLLFLLPVSAFAQCTSTWKGGTGSWDVAANWTPSGVPTSASNTCINVTSSAVTINGNDATSNLTLGTGTDSLTIANAEVLKVSGSTISNAGTITLNSIGNFTELQIGAANVTLSGAGTLTMSNNAENFIFGVANTNVLTNQSTIQGAGNIGNGQMELINSGTINANQSAGLTLQLSNIGTTTTGTNTGTIEATGGNTLTFLGGIYANAGGTILNNASTLVFSGNVIINGGTITQTGAGTIKLSNSTINTALTNSTTGTIEVMGSTTNTFGGTSGGPLTNPAGGQVKIDNGGILIMGAGSSISNAGTITLNSMGLFTELQIGAANVTLSGAGTLTMSNNTENFIFGVANTNVLTNQSTIQGAGNIGNGEMELNNSGTINANQSAGLTLQLSNIAMTTTGTNTGTIEATSGATLTVLGGTYTQTVAGKFLATGANSEVLLNNATIIGGTLTGASGGKFVAENGTTLNGVTINTGTMFNVNNAQMLNLAAGTITNKGTINLTSTGNTTEIVINGDVTLAGTGKVILSANANNFILGNGSFTLTNQNTIEGEGNIGDGTIGLINSGSILANETGTNAPSTLFIDTSSVGFTNNVGTKGGILNVSAKNTLIIEGGPFHNFSSGTLTGGSYLVAGELEFNAGSATGIVTNAATITLTGATAEILNTFNNTNALTGLTSNTSAGSFALAGSAKFTTVGDFTNNGTLNVGSGSKFSVGVLGAHNLTNFNSGTSTLTGGTYILTGSGQLQFNNGGHASDIVTNNAKITLAGVSSINSFIDQNNSNALASFATNGSSGSFILTTDRNFTTGGNLTNAGIVTVSKSTGTGHTQLTVNGNYTQTGGTTTVDGLLTTSGAINISGGFVYGNAGTVAGAATLTGNLTLTGGTINPGDGIKKAGVLNITGTYKQSGGILNIDLGGTTAGTNYDVLNVSGTASLGGILNVDLLTGFAPVAGDSFDILNSSADSNMFTTTNLPTVAGDHWTISYNSTGVVLNLVAGPVAPGAANPASKGAVSGSPATRVSRNTGAVASVANTHEPLAILSLATCSAARMLASMSCGERAAAALSHGNELHSVASAGSGLGTVHNNVAHNNVMAASAGPAAGTVHNNVMVATRSMSSARGGASNETSASASVMARLYVCAYMPSTVARTMGCSN